MLFKAIVCPSCQSTDIVKHGPSGEATVYTQVESELVSIRAEWTQTVAARVLR
jgi:hypothetical protein